MSYSPAFIDFAAIGSGNSGDPSLNQVTVPTADGASLAPMLGPSDRGIYATSNPDNASLPSGWSLVDSGEALVNVHVPAGQYLIFCITTWSGDTDGFRRIFPFNRGQAFSGLSDSKSGDDPIIASVWSVMGVSVVANDGDPLFQALNTNHQVLNTSAADATVSYFELDIYRIG